MSNTWNAVKLAFAAIGAAVGSFLGGVDKLVITLILFVVIDYITGVVCALIDKRLNSEVGARGIAKKVFIFLVVGMAHLLDANVFGGTAAFARRLYSFIWQTKDCPCLKTPYILGFPCRTASKVHLNSSKRAATSRGNRNSRPIWAARRNYGTDYCQGNV